MGDELLLSFVVVCFIFPETENDKTLRGCFWGPLDVFKDVSVLLFDGIRQPLPPSTSQRMLGLGIKASTPTPITPCATKTCSLRKETDDSSVQPHGGCSQEHDVFLKNIFPRNPLWSRRETIQFLHTGIFYDSFQGLLLTCSVPFSYT